MKTIPFHSSRAKRAVAFLAAIALATVGLQVLTAGEVPASATTTNGNGNATDVGTWFVTYNNASMWADNFGKGFPIKYRPLDQNGNYSIPDSSNAAQIDFYLGQMAAAGIDFILLDETNGGLPGTTYGQGNVWIVQNATLTAQRIALWNDAHAWKIKYAFAIGTHSAVCAGANPGLCAEQQAASVYTNYVQNATYGGTNDYYYVNGAPLLVLYTFDVPDPLAQWNGYGGSKTNGNLFTMRGANTSAAGQYGWQAASGPQLHPEVEVVSPGWDNHNPGCGSCSYSRSNGNRYEQNWNTVLTHAHPRIVMIQAFNDYNEESAIWTADTANLDTAHSEKWIGTDGVLHPSQYWDTTVAAIATLRGTTPVNLAKGATTAASSVYGPMPTSSMTDGNPASVYSSAAGIKTDHTEWAEVSLPAVTSFSQVTLVNRGDAAYGFPRNFQIQVWDGAGWQTRVTRTNYAQPAAGAAVTFSWPNADTTNRVRVLATSLGFDGNGDRLLQLAEFGVYRTTLPVDVAAGGSASASSVYAPLPTSNLNDGNRISVYSSSLGNKTDHTEWVQVNFPVTATFSRVTLVNRSDAAYGFPRNFQIQVWDGAGWQTRVTQTNYAQPAAGAAVSFTWGFSDTTDRIRIHATSLGIDNNNDRLLQFGAVEVYAN